MLFSLQDEEALEKLYTTLKERYKERYGNFVTITKIPNPPHSPFPNMAYAELIGNSLPPLPELPVVKQGKWVVYGRNDDDNELTAQRAIVKGKQHNTFRESKDWNCKDALLLSNVDKVIQYKDPFGSNSDICTCELL